MEQADVEGAYLNGNLDEELYLTPPDAVVLNNPRCNVLRLRKSIYGLRQSGRAWWLELSDALESLGFNRVQDEWGLHTRINKDGSSTIVLIYVDDILVAATSRDETLKVLNSLNDRWRTSSLGPPQHILGLRVQLLPNGSYGLSQTTYIETMARKYEVTNLKGGKSAPLPTVKQLSTLHPSSPKLEKPQAQTYLELVGILLWLANATRIDLAYTASFLGRYSPSCTQQLMDLAHRALGYAYHTRELTLILGNSKDPNFHIFVDSDFGGCLATRASTTGYVSFVYGSPISWTSRRQSSVASSSTAAEYIAAAEAVQEIMWLRRLLKQLGVLPSPKPPPTLLYIDNQASIHIGRKPVYFARTKSLDIKYHIVRERVEKKVVILKYVPSTDQLADGLTKPLGGPAHHAAQQQWQLRLFSRV